MSYFPAFPMPACHEDEDNKKYGDRRLVLDALSQTCRSLRRVFLRYRWERVEVYEKMDLGSGPLAVLSNFYMTPVQPSMLKKYAKELVRQLEVVTIREPALAELVKVLDVLVVDYSTRSVLAELARCIALMPNLHTIHIEFRIKNGGKLIPETFARYTYPQICSAYTQFEALSLLSRCPTVKALYFIKDSSALNRFLCSDKTLPSHSSLEIIGPIYVQFSRLFEHFIRLTRFEKLRDVAFLLPEAPAEKDMRGLWKIPSLAYIRIVFSYDMQWGSESEVEWQESDFGTNDREKFGWDN
ncbi:hypothetical protein BDN70DRAFT_919158 [Pholiota conissans]|uniref:Uncharacterized protein n=1 Tax=Pholiota conissans TaxID=109636 RepID=A0A9P5Z769_9AGAR|nr:hypothetical protein BDN70DRAFT_919158 [Pholiota conissans]